MNLRLIHNPRAAVAWEAGARWDPLGGTISLSAFGDAKGQGAPRRPRLPARRGAAAPDARHVLPGHPVGGIWSAFRPLGRILCGKRFVFNLKTATTGR